MQDGLGAIPRASPELGNAKDIPFWRAEPFSNIDSTSRTAHSSRAGIDPDAFGNISDERGQIVSISGRLIPPPAGANLVVL